MSRKLLLVAGLALAALGPAWADEIPDDEDQPAPAPRTAPPPAAPTPPPPPARRYEPAPPPVSAAPMPADKDWYVAASGVYGWPTCDDCEDGPGWQFAAGKEVARFLNLEASVTDRNYDYETRDNSNRVISYGLNGLFFITRNEAFAPFVLAGAGGNHASLGTGASSADYYGTAGVGFLTSPWSWDGALRGGVQWLQAFGSDRYDEGEALATLGLQIPFGGS